METGFEPVYTALQAVASPLGHSTVPGSRAYRADDGIRTRDPHLGKVMRYQLRYIRTALLMENTLYPHDPASIGGSLVPLTGASVSQLAYKG